MRGTFRSVVAIVAGFVAASAVMMVVESINGRVLYPELGKAAQGMTDREAIRALLATAPVGAFLAVIFGWALGSLVGGMVAGWIGRGDPSRHGGILGVLLTLAGVANNLMIPPPVWFWVASLVVLLPCSCVGARLATRGAAAPAA